MRNNHKSIIITLLLTNLVPTLFAQIKSATVVGGIGTRHNWNQYYVSPYSSSNGDLTGDWLRDISTPTNSTVSGGPATYVRGNNQVEDLVLYINHNIHGRYHDVANTNGAYTSNSTTIIGQDDPNVSSITGNSGDDPGNNQAKGRPENALTVYQWNWNHTKMGDYTLVEGNYIGGEGFGGAYFQDAGNISIEGSSFRAGTHAPDRHNTEVVNGGSANSAFAGGTVRTVNESVASGAFFRDVLNVVISNKTDHVSDRFEGARLTQSMNYVGGGTHDTDFTASGGDGAALQNTGTVTIRGGDFIGSQHDEGVTRSAQYDAFDTFNADVVTRGGRGASFVNTGKVTINDGNFTGGAAGSISVGGYSSFANAMGGAGVVISGSASSPEINGGTFTAGASGNAIVVPVGYYTYETTNRLTVVSQSNPTDADSTAIALGASGIRLSNAGTATIDNVSASGSAGAIAIANGERSIAEASGGSGLFSEDTDVTINSGTFEGKRGGSAASQFGTARALGGTGATAQGGSLTINGGTFTGGEGGIINNVRQAGNIGVMTYNADLSIGEQAVTNITVNGDVRFETTGANNLTLEEATIERDVYIMGTGTTTLQLSTNLQVGGKFIQSGGTVNTEGGSAMLQQFNLLSGTNNVNTAFSSAANSEWNIGNSAHLQFASDATFNVGSSLNLNSGTLTVANGNLNLTNANIQLAYQPTNTPITLSNGILNMEGSSKLSMYSTAATATGIFSLVSANGITTFDSASVTNHLDVSFGWLTQYDESDIDTTNGLSVTHRYRSLTNSAYAHSLFNTNQLIGIDGALSNSQHFASINALGQSDGSALILFDITQTPDIADAALDNQNYIHRQINARTMEMRARGGFAHNQTRSHLPAPTGVAGPQSAEESLTKGWVRGYGAFGSRDKSANYAAYDTTHFGTVIGIDRQFGSLLLGIAGGYSSLELDADTTYTAEADAYHGSLYASWGSSESFLDLAMARAQHDVKTENLLTSNKFDAQSTSFYIGAGREWNLNERLTWTPILAYQRTEYDQDGYLHDGILPKQMRTYDTSSDLLSLGATIAAARQYEWFNQHLAMVPEFRFRWLHELSPELDALTFDYVGGDAGSINIRPREENLFEIGLGIDFWSWHFYATKFEFDYDYLLGEEYTEHTFSGKMTFQF